MVESTYKAIPELSHYLVVDGIADKFDLWRDSFLQKAEEANYSLKKRKRKFLNAMKFRKGPRLYIDVTSQSLKNDVILHFHISHPEYIYALGGILMGLFFFFAVYMEELFAPQLGIPLSLLFLFLGSFYLLFVVLNIHAADFKRGLYFPRTIDQLMDFAQEAQKEVVLKETFEKSDVLEKPSYPKYQFVIVLQIAKEAVNRWRKNLLQRAGQQGFSIKSVKAFNEILLDKENHIFKVGFVPYQNITLVNVRERFKKYVVPIELTSIALAIICWVLYSIYDGNLLCLGLAVLFTVFPLLFLFLYLYFKFSQKFRVKLIDIVENAITDSY
ncbi:MAG: hypothetical protein HWN66_01185 [Candidatus Helarchaeota archaeon]|nr:hypothetical protein [Candidatus Helarchaeota archaeon]